MEKNIDVNLKVNTTGVRSLRSELKETINQLQQLEFGSAEFDKLNERAAELRDKISDTNEKIAVMATGSKFERVTNSIGEMTAGLADLDFGRVNEGAKLFAKNASAITFKDAIGSVKDLGGAFLNIGKALLTNPLFLLIGVIVAIVAGIVKLMDKLGILKKIFDFVGKAIDAVVQAIKDFLDWIGLTTFAAEDAAARQQEAYEKTAESAEELTKTITTRYDREIELAKIAGEDTTKAEIEKQNAIIKTQQTRYNAFLQIIEQNKISKKLDAEEIKAITDKAKGAREAIEEARHQKKVIQAQEVKDEKEKNAEIQKAESESYKKRKEQAKQFAQDRLDISRQIQDLELGLIAEGTEKELKLNELKYQRLIEDTKKNEKLLAEEKTNIVSLLEQEAQQTRQEIITKQVEEDNAQIEQTNTNRAEQKKAHEEELTRIQQEAGQMMLEKQKADNAERIANDKAVADARFALANGLVSGLTGLEKLLAQAGVKTAGLQKTIALVQIATDTAKAISATIAGATAAAAAGGPAAPFLIGAYIASGLGTVLGAVASAWAALKKAPSLGGGASGSAPSFSASGGAVPATPQVNLFGQNNNANNLSASQGVNAPIMVQAVVSETEITGVQNRIQRFNSNAEL